MKLKLLFTLAAILLMAGASLAPARDTGFRDARHLHHLSISVPVPNPPPQHMVMRP